MEIIIASSDDNKELTELTIQSKSYWGYSHAQIESWKDELTITSDYLKKNSVYKLIKKGTILGFYAYLIRDNNNIELDYFFISESCIGKGYGHLLMNHFLERVKSLNYSRVFLTADPNAEPFYIKSGFKTTKYIESKINERLLPYMELRFEDTVC
ncbi:GNAT family N-acetyltransferase [Joostella atrarenae]|uniref:GNAT family N-acetyltransferase n=1 Tax=Joostella atrarenae TaxID=679257 RepID=A0ABS9J1I0_9FLAO|nr:GNAT family N-acetyltransferase [Joostella atrarenae]MCF8714294.1 GNAT family N-acetyltransferase [Joostella atrarenae]